MNSSVRSVTAVASKMAVRVLIPLSREPCQTPQIAAGKNNSRQALGKEGTRNLARQNKHGKQHETILIQSVRFDIAATA